MENLKAKTEESDERSHLVVVLGNIQQYSRLTTDSVLRKSHWLGINMCLGVNMQLSGIKMGWAASKATLF